MCSSLERSSSVRQTHMNMHSSIIVLRVRFAGAQYMTLPNHSPATYYHKSNIQYVLHIQLLTVIAIYFESVYIQY